MQRFILKLSLSNQVIQDALTDSAPASVSFENAQMVINDAEAVPSSIDSATFPDVCEPEMKLLCSQRQFEQPSFIHECIPEKMFVISNGISAELAKHLIASHKFTEEEVRLQDYAQNRNRLRRDFIVRTNYKRTFIDRSLAKKIWDLVKLFLPRVLPDGRKLVGVRSRMNFYEYRQSAVFKTHLDGGHTFRHTGETSEYTFVIYRMLTKASQRTLIGSLILYSE